METEEEAEPTVLCSSQNLAISETRRLRTHILSPLVCTVCASIGIFGGIAALFIGLIFTVIHAAIGGDRSFDQAATVLLIAAIPALLIGSIFLDEIAGRCRVQDADVRKR